MAREGINKQLVQHAKTALLAQGKRPTIDAVRIALGNTGSKTTISNYLKELEEKPRPTIERLTEPLAHLVLCLSEQLQVESAEQLIKAQAQFSLEKNQLKLQLQTALKLADKQQHKLDKLEVRLLLTEQQRQEEMARLAEQASELALEQQRVEKLSGLMQEQYTQIALLHNEQEHARESFEQFRHTRQEIHNTLLQQHAQQVAHLSEELRCNSEQRLIMQKELLELHRENSRLLQKLSTWQSSLNDQ
ncbi:DNA-binding protein [Pseudomonas sp. BF-B-28]|uniref:DNA-binding protein n=1 Tax=Pseudomonas sp. BF-B-28 TaxID=2832353 RepID=UPI001CC15D4D|nr:DNA-binding protein [Pseudomonas sp. BF-B-28]